MNAFLKEKDERAKAFHDKQGGYAFGPDSSMSLRDYLGFIYMTPYRSSDSLHIASLGT